MDPSLSELSSALKRVESNTRQASMDVATAVPSKKAALANKFRYIRRYCDLVPQEGEWLDSFGHGADNLQLAYLLG